MPAFEFNITQPPPKGHEDVGKWAFQAYQLSRAWRDDELQMPTIWRENHKLFRGNHWGNNNKPNNITVNLFFSNVIRTVANITARHPVAEVVDLDGAGGDMAKKATARTKKWWLDSNQPYKLRATTLNSEIYGITWEKSVWNKRTMEPNTVVCDPFAIFPFPGYWENISTDCPAICHVTALDPKVVENMYGVKGVEINESYSLLGGERELAASTSGSSAYGTDVKTNLGYTVKSSSTGTKGDKALVIEVWCRDLSTKKEKVVDETGVESEEESPVYPGGIRCITICNEGNLVCSDEANPNLNFELPREALETNHLYSRFPIYKNNSYADSSSIFGFSAAEQTAHINIKIDELVSRLVNYAMRSMTGILVIPPKSGITKAHLNNKPNLVVFPQTTEAAKGIRFVPLPNPPSIVEKVLEMLISMHDRVHAIQDADRGETPKTITAASAIVALQERNAVLIQHKIDGIDYLVAQRGNYAIAQWQMHGHTIETVSVDDEIAEFSGIGMAGMRFNYTVESGSSMPKTSLQIQEQAAAYYEMGLIDQQAALENGNFPGWRKIIERMAQANPLQAAMQVLIQAGMPQDQAQMLFQQLQLIQGGPGNGPQTPPQQQPQQQPQPGMPRAQQGEIQ